MFHNGSNEGNRNGSRRFLDFEKEDFWVGIALPGGTAPNGFTAGTASNPDRLHKHASFHRIRYDSDSGSSCQLSAGSPECAVSLTWFSDGAFPGTSAFAHRVGGAEPLLIATDSVMEEFDWCIEQTLFWENGEPLNLGRKTRSISPALSRARRARLTECVDGQPDESRHEDAEDIRYDDEKQPEPRDAALLIVLVIGEVWLRMPAAPKSIAYVFDEELGHRYAPNQMPSPRPLPSAGSLVAPKMTSVGVVTSPAGAVGSVDGASGTGPACPARDAARVAPPSAGEADLAGSGRHGLSNGSNWMSSTGPS